MIEHGGQRGRGSVSPVPFTSRHSMAAGEWIEYRVHADDGETG